LIGKKTWFRPLIKMDMSISKKGLVNQFEPFEKPCFVIVGIPEIKCRTSTIGT
jgi:hypothetical protein